MATPPTRVLVEHENARVREAQGAALEAAGFEVTTCPGPAWQEDGCCPLVTRAYCRKALDADVIVNGLPLGHLRVYVAQESYLPDCPVLLGLSPSERARHPILHSLAACIPRNADDEVLVAAVREATREQALEGR